MRVILLKDVAKIGRRFDVVNVPDGYAMNKLVPQGMAQPATKENIKRVESRHNKLEAEASAETEQFSKIVAALPETPVVVTAKANPEGSLFQILKPETIAEALSAAVGQPVPVEFVEVSEQIKQTGLHEIMLQHGEDRTTYTIEVKAE